MLQNFQRGVAWALDLDRGWRKALQGRESCLLGFPDSEEREFSMQEVYLGLRPMEEEVGREEWRRGRQAEGDVQL